jgi:aerobic carbon-monoxide dehydrogenase large subunit
MSGSILGNAVLRREDSALLRGEGTFVANRKLEGAVHAVFVRSSIAHARITSIDTAEAAQAPGVVAVFTAADLELSPLPVALPMYPAAMGQPALAVDTVRYVGDAVAVVLAEDVYLGTEAAELVVVDYEPLPAVVRPSDAATDEILLYPEAGTNTVVAPGDSPLPDLDGFPVVIRQEIDNQRVAACPIEGRVAASVWGEDGRLTHYASSQGAGAVKQSIAAWLGIDPALIRVVNGDVGGGFGAKGMPHAEELLIPELARRVGRPVVWFETRTENMTGMFQGRAQHQTMTLAGDREGHIGYLRFDVLQDAGAYPKFGAFLPFFGTRRMASGVYAIPEIGFGGKAVVTNTTPIGAYRGAGRPEAAAAIERVIDVYAAEIGIDPAEVRRRNLIPDDAFPYTTAVGTVYDVGAYRRALDLALEAAGYDELRAEQSRRRVAGDTRQLGIGIGCYVEVTGIGGGDEHAEVTLLPDGRVRVVTGSTPYGQGHHTSWAMIVADRLGVAMDDVEVVHGDTDIVPTASVTGGSRSAQLAGSSILDAAGHLADKALPIAADLLEAAADDVVLDEDAGTFHVAGTPTRSVGWAQVAAAAEAPLCALNEWKQTTDTYPFGAHVSVVEVDTETGATTILRHVCVDDAGTILNPLIVDGQVHGGVAQGVAQALLEAVRYDDDGNPLTTNFADYTVVSSAELPMFERIPMETPTPLNPLGAKGIGESGTIGATPAVHNAIVDAVSHLGVRHIDMPCTPERVWDAIAAARGD